MNTIEQPVSSNQYDAQQVAEFFDVYRIQEWHRLTQDSANDFLSWQLSNSYTPRKYGPKVHLTVNSIKFLS